MILSSLCDLAHRERLLENPDYEPKPVAWIIELGEGGRFLGLIATGKGKKLSIPRRQGRASAPVADFLVDKSEYVLGTCRQEKLPKPRKPEDLLLRSRLFRERIEAASTATGAAALAAVCAFLTDDEALGRCAEEAATADYRNNDLFAFRYQGEFVHDLPAVQAWFSAHRVSTDEPGVPCLVCGNERPPVDKHPGIKLPGGTTSGVAMVSFNSSAFESYGLERNQNAPVCRACADAYTTALTRCIEKEYLNPRGETLSPRSVRISPNTIAVYWADTDTGLVDEIRSLFDEVHPETVRSLIDSPWKGRAPAELDARFYCLLLSGGQGRATVRGLHTETVGMLAENVRDYFRSLQLGDAAPLPLWRLLASLCLQGKTENLPPGLAGDFFVAVLFGRPYPRSVLAAAAGRCRAERKVTQPRAALLRAVLVRKGSLSLEDTVGLDKDNRQPGYRLGRLLAVLEWLQGSAQRNLNKTIVDRYYGAASTRPATVFPALIRLAQHHVAKTPAPGFHQKNLGEVLDGIDRFPPTLSLEEQGLFALGYYQQRQEFFRGRQTETESGESE